MLQWAEEVARLSRLLKGGKTFPESAALTRGIDKKGVTEPATLVVLLLLLHQLAYASLMLVSVSGCLELLLEQTTLLRQRTHHHHFVSVVMIISNI